MKTNAFSGRGLLFIVLFIGICLLGISPVNGQIASMANDLIVYPAGNILSTDVTDNSYVLIVGDSTSRISNQEIESAQNRVIENYKSQRNLRNISVLVTYPCTENTSTMAYGFSIRNRTVYSLTMMIPNDTVVNEDSFKDTRARVKEWYYKLPPMTDADFQTDSTFDALPFTNDAQEQPDSPYGKLMSTLSTENSGHTDSAKTQYGYIEKDAFSITPGLNAYSPSSHWYVDTFESKHDYSISELASTTEHDHKPSGAHSGSESYSITVSLPLSISSTWGHSQEDYSRVDRSNQPSYSYLIFTANSDEARKSSEMIYPGSSAYYTIPSEKKTYNFLGIRDHANFCLYGSCLLMGSHTTKLDYNLALKYS
jgi:hypothetical protein